MKKHFASFILLACLLLCTLGMGTAYADDTTATVTTDERFREVLGNSSITNITVEADIDFNPELYITRDVTINWGNYTITGKIVKDVSDEAEFKAALNDSQLYPHQADEGHHFHL